MIELARPAYLWAGAVLASIPLLLHLLRPRERVRKPLPTIRFLTSDPRRRVRLHRRPDQIRLLLLRMTIGATIGAAFAGPHWIGPADGTATIVVVDGGAAMRPAWGAVRDLVVPSGRTDRVDLALVRPGESGAPTLVRLGPESPVGEAWTELAPEEQAGEVRLAHLLRALRDVAARSTGVDSLSARVVAVPGWGAWGPGMRELRDSLWPGRIELVVPPAPEGSASRAPVTVVVQADAGVRAAVATALDVLGLPVDTTAGAAGGDADVTLRVGREESLRPLWQARPDSDSATAPDGDSATPPDTAPAAVEGRSAFTDAFLLLDGRVLPGAGSPPRGTPAPGYAVPLLRAGGRPAAAARGGARACEIALPLEPDAPIVGSGDLPVLLEAVLREACGGPEAAGAEEAWRALLERGGTGAPDSGVSGAGAPEAGGHPAERARVAAADVRGAGAGMPLARSLLVLALVMGITEIWITRRMDDRRSRSA